MYVPQKGTGVGKQKSCMLEAGAAAHLPFLASFSSHRFSLRKCESPSSLAPAPGISSHQTQVNLSAVSWLAVKGVIYGGPSMSQAVSCYG